MKHGFYLGLGNHTYFFETYKEYASKYVVCKMIDQVCKQKGKSKKFANQCKEDAATRKDIKSRCCKATLNVSHTKSGIKFFTIEGKGFTEVIPEPVAQTLIIFN